MTIADLIPQIPPDLPPATPQRDGLRWEVSPYRWVHVRPEVDGVRVSFADGSDHGTAHVTRAWLVVAWVRALYPAPLPIIR